VVLLTGRSEFTAPAVGLWVTDEDDGEGAGGAFKGINNIFEVAASARCQLKNYM